MKLLLVSQLKYKKRKCPQTESKLKTQKLGTKESHSVPG
jgi:hypothetical protein